MCGWPIRASLCIPNFHGKNLNKNGRGLCGGCLISPIALNRRRESKPAWLVWPVPGKFPQAFCCSAVDFCGCGHFSFYFLLQLLFPVFTQMCGQVLVEMISSSQDHYSRHAWPRLFLVHWQRSHRNILLAFARGGLDTAIFSIFSSRQLSLFADELFYQPDDVHIHAGSMASAPAPPIRGGTWRLRVVGDGCICSVPWC